jgi:hypothetical protein
MAREFEKIRVFGFAWGAFKKGAAITIPGIGIFVNPKDKDNIDLLRHEFGHVLQARTWGFWFFITKIAITSLKSARKANRNKQYKHMSMWTEYTANKLAYAYFNAPKDWNFKEYPIYPESPLSSNSSIPAKVRATLQ